MNAAAARQPTRAGGPYTFQVTTRAGRTVTQVTVWGTGYYDAADKAMTKVRGRGLTVTDVIAETVIVAGR